MSCFHRMSLRSLGHISNVSLTRTRRFSISSEDSLKHSFAVSYLINSLGFSKHNALLASKYVKFESREKADETIEFFNKHGFTAPQITAIVRNNPRILLTDTDQFISPKLEFLRAKGLSGPESASMISKFPTFIGASLANRIAPSYDFWREVFGSEEKAVSAVKQSLDILRYSLEKHVSPNVEALRERGVSGSHIFTMVAHWPRVFARCPVEFRRAVEEVVEMGFDVSKTKFVQAIVAVLLGMRESKWERKVEAYTKWGWSEEEFLTAFKLYPTCMLLSVHNIAASMEFFVVEMGLEPGKLVKCPVIFTYALKRVKLRWSVYCALLSKGLLGRNDVRVLKLASYAEIKFVETYIRPYAKEFPELLDLYKGKSKAKTLP